MDSQSGLAENQVGEAPRGRESKGSEPGVSVHRRFANDLEEEVNCTFMKFSAEKQKRKHQGK